MRNYEPSDDLGLKQAQSIMRWGVVGTILFIAVICGSLWGCPQYNVYTQKLEGQAQLAKAESSKQVAVQTAIAKEESAKHLALAEIERANGSAKANEMLIKSLGTPDAYLMWRYIQMLEESENSVNRQIIYIPTNGVMPILEAGRTTFAPPAIIAGQAPTEHKK